MSNSNLNMYKQLIIALLSAVKLSSGSKYEAEDLAYSLHEPSSEDNRARDSGFPVLVLHGLFGCKDNWRSISKQLAEKTNRKVFTLDARNHGESPHTKELSYNLMAADVVKFMQKLNIEKATIIGHSMGGKTCMLTALLYPELIESLIIVDISPHGVSAGFEDMSKYAKLMLDVKFPNEKFTSLYQYRKEATRQLKGTIKDPAILQFLLTNFVEVKRNDKLYYEWRMNLQSIYENFYHIGHFNCAEVGGKYEGRTLFIGGEKSDYIRKDSHALIKQLFPKADINYIPGAGHWVHAEKPKDFVNMAGDFINNN